MYNILGLEFSIDSNFSLQYSAVQLSSSCETNQKIKYL